MAYAKFLAKVLTNFFTGMAVVMTAILILRKQKKEYPQRGGRKEGRKEGKLPYHYHPQKKYGNETKPRSHIYIFPALHYREKQPITSLHTTGYPTGHDACY